MRTISINSMIPPRNCNHCARCCTWEVEVYNEDNIPEHMTEIIGNNVKVMKRNDKANVCIALDVNTLKCTIYNNRPTVCEEFELGSRACLEARHTAPIICYKERKGDIICQDLGNIKEQKK